MDKRNCKPMIQTLAFHIHWRVSRIFFPFGSAVHISFPGICLLEISPVISVSTTAVCKNERAVASESGTGKTRTQALWHRRTCDQMSAAQRVLGWCGSPGFLTGIPGKRSTSEPHLSPPGSRSYRPVPASAPDRPTGGAQRFGHGHRRGTALQGKPLHSLL